MTYFSTKPYDVPILKSSLLDDSNELSQHRVWLRNKKVRILKTINFRPYLLPGVDTAASIRPRNNQPSPGANL